jgi:hypothetical protein
MMASGYTTHQPVQLSTASNATGLSFCLIEGSVPLLLGRRFPVPDRAIAPG